MNEYVRANGRVSNIEIDSLTDSDLEDIVALFANAAIRAEKAGFDGVQLHLAYGWLLSRFATPYYNHRSDIYGGTVENRTRIIKRIIHAIRKNCPALHISAKFSFYDDDSGNFDVLAGVDICRELEKAEIDSIEVLGGHSTKERGTKYETCYLDLGIAVKNAVKVPIILTGNNHNIENMRELQNTYGIDFFGMSRPLIREPNLPEKWMKGVTSSAKCISCSKCYTTHGKCCFFV